MVNLNSICQLSLANYSPQPAPKEQHTYQNQTLQFHLHFLNLMSIYPLQSQILHYHNKPKNQLEEIWLICFLVKFHNDSINKYFNPFDSCWFAIYLYSFLGSKGQTKTESFSMGSNNLIVRACTVYDIFIDSYCT